MKNINVVFLTGNLTRDAEVRTTAEGSVIATFGIACNESQRDGDGWKDYANFFNCTMFGQRAEAVSKYLAKGAKVSIKGKLHWSKWTDNRSGEERSGVNIIVDEVEFMSRREQKEEAQKPQQQAVESPYSMSMYEEDIPF